MNQTHLEWCRNVFAMLAEGGTWGVPRSGLVFTKRDGVLVLVDRMPHVPEMPLSADALYEYQTEDYEDIRRHFEAAGITVTREEEA